MKYGENQETQTEILNEIILCRYIYLNFFCISKDFFSVCKTGLFRISLFFFFFFYILVFHKQLDWIKAENSFKRIKTDIKTEEKKKDLLIKTFHKSESYNQVEDIRRKKKHTEIEDNIPSKKINKTICLYFFFL